MPTYHREQAKCREVEVVEGEDTLLNKVHERLKQPIPFALHGARCQCGHARGLHCQCGETCMECGECLGFGQDADGQGSEEEPQEPTLG